MKKIGFFIAHGVEARYFILSGIIEAIKTSNKVVVFVSNTINSSFLNEYVSLYNIEVVKIPIINKSNKAKYVDRFARFLRNSRRRLNGVKIYSHFGNISNRKRILDFVFGNIFVHIFFDFFLRKLSIQFNHNKELEELLLKNKINEFYMLEYNNQVNNAIGSVCSKNKIKTHLFLNTLKTVFINDFIPYRIYRLHTWNNFQKKIYSDANPNISSQAFIASGSPFHTFLRNIDEKNIKVTKDKYQLEISRPIILYPLIYEKVYSNEHLIIEKINTFFNTFSKETRPQLVLRQNPFQENDFLLKYVQNFSNVIIADNFWERNATLNWSIQSIKGELEWKALLQVANLMISYPSMSIVECIGVGTPVLNIGFDHKGFENTG